MQIHKEGDDPPLCKFDHRVLFTVHVLLNHEKFKKTGAKSYCSRDADERFSNFY